jgi:iron transport multicopper oxidase
MRFDRALAALAAVPAVLAANVNVQMNIVNAAVSPDGFSRQAVLVNGVYPGTTIFANKGDTLLLNVSNQLTNPTMRRSTTIVRAFVARIRAKLSYSRLSSS